LRLPGLRGCPKRGQDPLIRLVSPYFSERLKGSCPLFGQPVSARCFCESRGFALRAGLSERRDQVQDGAELRQPHAVAVQEFLKCKISVETCVLIADAVGQVLNELAVAALQHRQRLAATFAQVGELLLPTRQEAAPARGLIVGCSGRLLVGELL